MSRHCSESFSKYSSSSFAQDILIQYILLTHDPEDHDLDSEMLLRVIETIMDHATSSEDSVGQQDSVDITRISIDGLEEPAAETSVYKISCEILCVFYERKDVHATTMSVLQLLGSYRWGAKLLLALTAFAMVYGEMWIIRQSYKHNPLATLIAVLKQFDPDNFNSASTSLKALSRLVKTIIQVIRCITRFEGLPLSFVQLQDETLKATKSSIHVATYWIIRSLMVCISLVSNMRTIKDEDPCSASLEVWEITSLKSKISTIGNQLRIQVDACQHETEQKMHKMLKNVFQETHYDNQEVLRTFFATKTDLLLRQSGERPKLGIPSLKEKVVILLISKPELLPIDDLYFLVHQTYNHPFLSIQDGNCDIVWIPISTLEKWSNSEAATYTFLSNSLPWYSIQQPWSLSSITINYAKVEWKYEDKPIMVVLDLKGRVTNANAIDIVYIWGMRGFPFTNLREKELWAEEKWNLNLLLDNLSPLLAMWVKEGRTICIYGSNRVDWIRDFNAQIKEIQGSAGKIEVVYFGKKGPSELSNNIISVIDKERLSNYLSATKMYFFWSRLESMRKSKLRLGLTSDNDHILRKVETLLATTEYHNDDDWIIIGTGSSTNMIELDGNQWVKLWNNYSTLVKYLQKVDLQDAIRLSLDPPAEEPCADPTVMSYNEGLTEETVICEKCQRPRDKFIVYDVIE